MTDRISYESYPFDVVIQQLECNWETVHYAWVTPNWGFFVRLKSLGGRLIVVVGKIVEGNESPVTGAGLYVSNGRNGASVPLSLQLSDQGHTTESLNTHVSRNRILLELKVPNQYSSSKEFLASRIPVPESRLGEELGVLMEAENKADVKMECIDGERLHFHSTVVETRAPSYKERHASWWPNNLTCWRRDTDRTGWLGRVLRAWLVFIYTDELPGSLDLETLISLRFAAAEDHLPRLAALCDRRLVLTLHPENVVRIFNSAVRVESLPLVNAIRHFMSSRQSREHVSKIIPQLPCMRGFGSFISLDDVKNFVRSFDLTDQVEKSLRKTLCNKTLASNLQDDNDFKHINICKQLFSKLECSIENEISNGFGNY